MTIISFNSTRPPARNDGDPWVLMQIEESADGITSQGQIEVKSLETGPDMIPLGLDVNPQLPASRDWSSSAAVLAPGDGYYRVRFVDADGDVSEYSEWENSNPRPWIPTTRDVGRRIKNRTLQSGTNTFLGDFTNETVVTRDEVTEIIQDASDEVLGALDQDPDFALPEDSYRNVRALIALRAAMEVELTKFSEQINTQRSPYPQLKELFDSRLAQVREDVLGIVAGDGSTGGGGGVGVSGAQWYFDQVEPLEW